MISDDTDQSASSPSDLPAGAESADATDVASNGASDALRPPSEAHAPAPAPVVAPPKADDANLPFIEALHKLLPRLTVENSIRMSRQGTFVDEKIVPNIIEAYQRFIQEGTDRTEKKSEEKIRRKLFGPEAPKLYYALDGKRCLTGYLLAGSVGEAQKVRLPNYQAPLLDTWESVHPRDPVIAAYEHVHPRLSPKEGFYLEFQTPHVRYDLDEGAVKNIVRVLRAEQGFVKEQPSIQLPLRHALPAILEFLGRLRPSNDGQRLLVPERVKGRQGLQFLRYRGFVCALEGEHKIAALYEVKGKGLGRFLRDEIAALRQPDNTSLVRNFDGKTGKVQFLGKVWAKGMSFHLHLRAYRLFEREVLKSEAGPGRAPAKYSVRDVLDRLASSFLRAQPVDEVSILTLLGKRRQPFAKYRRGRGWIFVVTDKNVIFSAIRIEGEALEPVRNNNRPQGDRRDDRRGAPGERRGDPRKGGRRDQKGRRNGRSEGERGRGRDDRGGAAGEANRGGPPRGGQPSGGPSRGGAGRSGPNDRRGGGGQRDGQRRDVRDVSTRPPRSGAKPGGGSGGKV